MSYIYPLRTMQGSAHMAAEIESTVHVGKLNRGRDLTYTSYDDYVTLFPDESSPSVLVSATYE